MCNLSFSHFTETESAAQGEKCLMPQDKVQKKAHQSFFIHASGNANQRWLTDDNNKIKGNRAENARTNSIIKSEKGDPVVLADCDFSRATGISIG